MDETHIDMRMAAMRGRGGSEVSTDCTQRQNFFSAETSTLRAAAAVEHHLRERDLSVRHAESAARVN
jgi:hypothetical protein